MRDFALKPVNVNVLIRTSSNRNLVNGYKLFDHADGLPGAGRSGQPRQARLALRFGPVTIKRPERGMPSPDLKRLPQTDGRHLVDIREADAPKGVEPIHWRLLTSHVIEDFDVARLMLDF